MNIIPDIRQLYKPVQPTIMQSAENVSYCEFPPAPALQTNIYCYRQLHTSQPLDNPFYYRVVADGCIDIFFELNNPQENFVMGFCRKYTEFQLDNSFNYVGIRFLPTTFPQLFKIDASELSNRFENLSAVIPETASFIANRFHPAMTTTEIRSILDNYFLELLSKTRFDHDPRLYNAISIILKNGGRINVETDLDTGLSPRQLRRIFQFYVGDTPKTFSKVVRFQNILRGKPSQNPGERKVGMDGYYDQAHFIKEFTNFYGVTPGKVFGR